MNSRTGKLLQNNNTPEWKFFFVKVRPEYSSKHSFQVLTKQWIQSSQTSESIGMYRHRLKYKFVKNRFFSASYTAAFEQNLCELVEQLKQLFYLDIYGDIDREKVNSYLSMVKRRFPNSRVYVDRSRFRLWI